MEESQRMKQELRDKVKNWIEANPNWVNSDVMQNVKSKVNQRTWEGYVSVLPIFCYYMDKTPDEIISQREEQLKSEDRKTMFYYEDKFEEFKQLLVDHHYGSKTIKSYLGRVAGLFSNNRLGLNLDNLFWSRANKTSSEIAQALETTKRYPSNDEVRLILELADNKQALGILFGYQCGLTPTDIVALTWDRLNVDFDTEEREFIHVENVRDKTGAHHVIILSPDIIYFLKAHWASIGKPSSGWIFEGYQGTSMSPRNLNAYFKDLAGKVLTEARGSELMFKDLRDSFNEAILDSEVNEEIKDILMGHVRASAKGSYSFSTATVVRIYKEYVFPKLAVNGWNLKKKATEVDELREQVSKLENALTQIEKENHAYRTRIDGLQTSIDSLSRRLDESTASHVLFMNKLMKTGGYSLDTIPTDEEVEEYLKRSE